MELTYKQVEDYIFEDIREKLFDVVEGKEEEAGSDFLYPHHIERILNERYIAKLDHEQTDQNGWEPDLWYVIEISDKQTSILLCKLTVALSGQYGGLTVTLNDCDEC